MDGKIFILFTIVFCVVQAAPEGILSHFLGGNTNEANPPTGSSAQSESKSFSQGINLGPIGFSTSITSSKASARSDGLGSVDDGNNRGVQAAAHSRI